MSRPISYRRWTAAALLFGCTLTAGAADAPASTYPVAGLAPWARPKAAPTIGRFVPRKEARAQWTQGIEGDQSLGLGFLDSQEAWYSPFTRPGMPGYYDIRGWHRKPEKR